MAERRVSRGSTDAMCDEGVLKLFLTAEVPRPASGMSVTDRNESQMSCRNLCFNPIEIVDHHQLQLNRHIAQKFTVILRGYRMAGAVVSEEIGDIKGRMSMRHINGRLQVA